VGDFRGEGQRTIEKARTNQKMERRSLQEKSEGLKSPRLFPLADFTTVSVGGNSGAKKGPKYWGHACVVAGFSVRRRLPGLFFGSIRFSGNIGFFGILFGAPFNYYCTNHMIER